MQPFLTLASASGSRRALLENAGLIVEVVPARIDESAMRQALAAEGASSRDIADALAGSKAAKISRRHPDRLVLGCDQILDHRGEILAKPDSPEDVRAQLESLLADRHDLLSAAVVCEDGQAIWRHVGVARLTMRNASSAYLDDYVARNWESIRHSIGGYKLEEEGVRLFSTIEGDYFTILGLPLLPLLSWLTARGTLPQ